MRNLLIISIIFYNSILFAQDERLLRGFLEYNPPKRIEDVQDFKRVKAMSDFYAIDLNGDYRNEKILIEKNDGIDFITIRDYQSNVVFRQRFDTQGIDSRVHRIHVKHISKDTLVLLIYYFEGKVDYLEFLATGRLYFLTLDKRDLNSLKMFKGPYYWNEKKGKKGEYFQRKYEVSFTDLNEDGIKDILVKHHLISRAYLYEGSGVWKSFNETKKPL